MLRKFKRALILAPHCDDAEIGVGGTISKMLQNGTEVYCVILSGKGKRKEEALKAAFSMNYTDCKIFDFPDTYFDKHRQKILDLLRELKNEIKPDIVFCPSENDLHQDHSTLGKEALREFKDITLLTYDNPWKFFKFRPNIFVSLNEKQLRKKLEAISIFKSQKDKIFCNPRMIKAWAIFRGGTVSLKYAEAFELKHMVI